MNNFYFQIAAVHCTKLNEDFDGTIEEVILICNALSETLQSVLQFHESSLNHHAKNDNDKMKLKGDQVFKLQMPIDKQSIVDAFESMQDNNIPFVFNKYYEFFYKGTNLNKINQTMYLSNFIENFDPWSWFKTLASSTFIDTSLFLNATGLTEFGNSQLNAIKNWLPFLSSTKPYIVETITIKRQLEWLICPISFEIKHNPLKFQVLNYRKKYIKCKLLRNTVNTSGHLLIYLFSPNYFKKEYDISNSFLSDWSIKLPGCSILVPELVYDKNEKFITPLQDCLDIYLWAIGKNNCANKIELLKMPKQFSTNNSNENLTTKRNHHSHSRSSSISGLTSFFNNSLTSNSLNSNPKLNSSTATTILKNSDEILDKIPDHITIAGDSTGGSLACSLLFVLNDLRIKFKFKDLKLPNALVLAYTPFNLRDYSPIMLTSRFNLGTLSPIISLTTLESNLPLPEIDLDNNSLITIKESSSKKEMANEANSSEELLDKSIKDNKQNDKSNEILKQQQQQQNQKETIKQRRKKRSNSMNKYLIDRLNECKLSDFFQQFGLNESSTSSNKEDDEDLLNELNEKTVLDGDEATTTDSDDVAFNSSNEELNLSYIAKALINYLSQYYNTHISNQINSYEASDEELDCKKELKKMSNDKLNENKLTNNQVKSKPIKITNQKNLNLDQTVELDEKLMNQENASLIAQVQNAFTMFRLFFNGSEKKSTESEWNKEVVEKIFTDQRETAFLDLTSMFFAYLNHTLIYLLF